MVEAGCEFLAGCGTPQGLIVYDRTGPKGERKLWLEQPFALLGRCDLADVVIGDPDVSWWHASVQVLDGVPFLMDLGSESGTYMDVCADGRSWLRSGQLVRVGGHCLRFENPSTSRDRPVHDPLARGSAPAYASLEIAYKDGRPAQWPLNRQLTMVGKSPECKVRLRGRSIAPFHCYFVTLPSEVWIVDLSRRPGILVNGERKLCARLRHGDELSMGDFSLRLRHSARRKSGIVLDIPNSGPALAYLNGSPPKAPAVAQNPLDAAQPETTEGDTSRSLVPAPQTSTNGDSSPIAGVAALSGLVAPPTNLNLLTGVLDSAKAGSSMTQGEAELLQNVLVPVVNNFNVVQQQMFDQFNQTLMMFFQMFGGLFKQQFELIQDELEQVKKMTDELATLRTQLTSSRLDPSETDLPATASASGALNGAHATSTQEEPVATERGLASSGQTTGATPPVEVHGWLCQRMAKVQQERQSRWQKILGTLFGSRPGVSPG